MASSFQFPRTLFLLLGACLVSLSAPLTSRAQLIDTGTPQSIFYSYSLQTDLFPQAPNDYVWAAGKISFSEPTTITAIQVWMSVLSKGFLGFDIAQDSGGKPGAVLDSIGGLYLFPPGSQWTGINGLNWSLSAGDYWLELIPFVQSGQFFLEGSPPNPLSAYLVQLPTTNGWVPTISAFGTRIYGTQQAPLSSVPESSTYGYGMGAGLLLLVLKHKRHHRPRNRT